MEDKKEGLTRPLYPRPKNVMVINDVPVKIEIDNGEKFSAPSNMSMLTSLRTGKVNVWDNTPSDHKGIKLTDIFTTYLDYSYFEEGNYDFCKEFKKRKDLEVTEDGSLKDKESDTIFLSVPHQKDLYISNRLWLQVCSLIDEIEKVQPKLIIVTGKWSLFFLTGCTTFGQNMGNYKDKKPFGGLTKFRSSVLQPHSCWQLPETILVPIYHPVNATGMLDKAPIMELDIQKLGYMYHNILEKGTGYYIVPDKKYILGTTKEIVLDYLDKILEKLELGPTKTSIDDETMFHSVIDCIGLTTEIDEGLCIPFATVDNPNYWSWSDELEILLKLHSVMVHPNCLHVGQNYQYDCQYAYKIWCMNVKASEDTMVKHHMLYNFLPKDLATLASLYCEFYTYWKDEITAEKETPETRWTYNVKDICNTLEVDQVLTDVMEQAPPKLQELYRFQIDRLSPLLVSMMNRGVRIDVEEKERQFKFFSGLMEDIKQAINDTLGFEFNVNSTPQKKKVFQDFLGIKLKFKKGKGGAKTETCDSSAMLQYLEEYPEYRPFLGLLLEYNSIKVFTTNFLGMRLDSDGRARTQYKIAGTGTGRLASTKNVWGTGGNLQNIPEKGKLPLKYTLELLNLKTEEQPEDDWDEFIEATIMAEEREVEVDG